jgi:hypothetical protein
MPLDTASWLMRCAYRRLWPWLVIVRWFFGAPALDRDEELISQILSIVCADTAFQYGDEQIVAEVGDYLRHQKRRQLTMRSSLTGISIPSSTLSRPINLEIRRFGTLSAFPNFMRLRHKSG